MLCMLVKMLKIMNDPLHKKKKPSWHTSDRTVAVKFLSSLACYVLLKMREPTRQTKQLHLSSVA